MRVRNMGGIVPWGEVRGAAKEGVRKETEGVGCWESQGQVEDISEGQDSRCPLVIAVSFERESLRRVSLWGCSQRPAVSPESRLLALALVPGTIYAPELRPCSGWRNTW